MINRILIQSQHLKPQKKKKSNLLRISHTRDTHGYQMENTEPPICPSRNTNSTIKHIISQSKIFSEAREDCHIPDNLYEAIELYSDTNKIFTNLKK